MQMRYLAILPALIFSTAALAQQLPGNINAVTVTPAAAKVGQPVNVTITTEGEPQTHCGLRINFGDGEVREIKIGSGHSSFPVSVKKTYAKAGNFVVKARGTTINTRGRCQGEAEAKIAVATALTATDPATPCPQDYKLKGKVGKAGEFTCSADKGAKKPEKILECKEGLEYFQSKTTLGCRKAPAAKK